MDATMMIASFILELLLDVDVGCHDQWEER
jgi:hypothetical protein